MRNNPYKNMIKVLTPKKGERLVIQRDGDNVYMTETHVAFCVRYSLYDSYIHGEKPLQFPALNDGDCISNGEPCNMDIKQCMSKNDRGRFDAIATDFIKVIKDAQARMFLISDGHDYIPLIVNEKFYQTIEPFMNDSDSKLESCGKSNYPIWFECDAITALLLPIRYCDCDMRKHGKALADLSDIDLLTARNNVA